MFKPKSSPFWDVTQCMLGVIDVSGQHSGSIFKAEAVVLLLTTNLFCVAFQKSKYHIYKAVEA